MIFVKYESRTFENTVGTKLVKLPEVSFCCGLTECKCGVFSQRPNGRM